MPTPDAAERRPPTAARTCPSAATSSSSPAAALDDGQADDAAVHLALVVRLTPALAPAVLELIGDDRRPELALVRGDAYRLVGLETEARQAYADVPRPAPRAHPSGADASPTPTTIPTDPRHTGDPA